MIESDPTGSAAVVIVATPPLRVTGEPICVPPSKNVTVPVAVPVPGALTATVALNVTGLPNAVLPLLLTTTVVVASWLAAWVRVDDVPATKWASPP